MANKGYAIFQEKREKAQRLLEDAGLDQWTKRQYDLRQSQADFDNYLSSGDYNSENNKKYRDMATKAVADLDAEMKQYASNSNERKFLNQYKTYYQNALPSFDRMDVSANMRDYLSYDPNSNRFNNWHSEEDYNTQKSYIDQQKQLLQTEMDAIEDQTSADYQSLKSWMDQYDLLSDALEERNTYDRQFQDINDYTAFERSSDYKNTIQAKQTLRQAQEQLKDLEAQIKPLEMKFNGYTDLSSLAGADAEAYQQLSDLRQQYAKQQENVLQLTSEVAGMEKWQKDAAIANYYMQYGADADYQQILDDLIEARNKAKEGSEDWAKIDLQIRALAGENENGLNANGQYDDNTLYGRAVMRDFNMEAAQKRLDEINQELKDLGVSESRFWGMVSDADNNFGVDAAGMVYTDDSRAGESDPRVMALRQEKTELTRKMNSAGKFQEKDSAERAFSNLSEAEHQALQEEGTKHLTQKGNTYYRDIGVGAEEGSGVLDNFRYLNDTEKLDALPQKYKYYADHAKEIRDMLVEALGAEATGKDIGYTVDDVLRLYEGDINLISGLLSSQDISNMESDFLRWNRQVFGVGTQAGLNQFATGIQQAFSDDYIEPNKTAYKAQFTREDLKRYGDEQVANGANVSQVLFDTTQTTANMLPMIVSSYLLSAAGMPQAAGALVGATLMGLSSGGNTYQQALAEGWDKTDAKAYATILGAAEGTMQYLIGGIGALGGVGEEQLLRAAAGINNAAVRFATETGIHILSETTEELAQNRLQRYLDYKLGASDNPDWMSWNDDDWYTVIVTALSTGALEGPSTAININRNTRLGEQLSGQRTIPTKASSQSAQAQNAVIAEIGKAMQSQEALKETLVTIGKNVMEQGTEAYDLADRLSSGKAAMNAANLGMLYSEIVSEYVERNGKIGYDQATAAIIGGGIKYNELASAKTALEQAEAQAAEVRKANPGADVLGLNETQLVNRGVSATSAKEFAPIINKVLSGTDLTNTEMKSILGDSTAARASREILASQNSDPNALQLIRLSLTRENADGAREVIENQIQQVKDAKKLKAEADKVAVAEAAAEAADKMQVSIAAANADRVSASTIQAVQKADADVEAAQQRVEQIKKMSFKELGKTKILEDLSAENAGLVNAAIDRGVYEDLQHRMETLEKRAEKLSAIKFPSKEQRAQLADIRQQQAAIKQQMSGMVQAIADRVVARMQNTEAKSGEDQSKPEKNSSGSAGDVININGAEITRDEFLASRKAAIESGERTVEDVNAEFDAMLAGTGATVKENVNGRDQSSTADEGRNDVHNAADRGEDRSGADRSGETGVERSDENGTEVPGENKEEVSRRNENGEYPGRQEFAKGGVLFEATEKNAAVRVGEGATVYNGFGDWHFPNTSYSNVDASLGRSLRDSGFTGVRYVVGGKILVTDPASGKQVSVAAVVRGTEMVLALDFKKAGYDPVRTAEHERTHLRLRFLEKALGETEKNKFVSYVLEQSLERDQYENAFQKYLAKYGDMYYKNGATDIDTLGHMINEEMFCDMAAGINEWGTDLGEYEGDVEAFMTETNFDVTVDAITNGEEDATVALEYYSEPDENALPFSYQMKETLDITDPFRHDIDRTKPPEARPLAGEEALHEDQQLMSLQSMAEATGFELIENDEGYPYGLRNIKTGEVITRATPDMMRDTPIGSLVQSAVDKKFISNTDAEKEYKMLSDAMNLILKNKDAALTWELVGSQLFSGVKKNSDTQYNWTIDFGTICRKTQALVNAMSATMKKLGHGLSRREIEAVYLETGLAGEATPCPVCYVFSRWMGIGGLLDDINTFQNTYFDIDQKTGKFEWAEGKSEEDLAEFMTDIDNSIVDWAKQKAKKDFFRDENAANKFDRNNLNFGKVLSDMKSSPNRRQADAIKKINDSRQAQLLITELENQAKETTPEHAAKILKAADTVRDYVLSDEQIKALQVKLEEAEAELAKFDLYQWADRTVMRRAPGKLDENGDRTFQWKMRPDYKPVVQDVLFDLNKGGEFAKNYPLTWAFRTGKGNAMGKAIVPYSDARVGETIQGVAEGDVKVLNEEMVEKMGISPADKKAVKRAMKAAKANILSGSSINPLLNGDTKEWNRIMEKASNAIRRQNLIGGMRMQSTSDFRFEWGSDYLITFFELQAIGANVQLYTKVIEAVDFLASTGADCNLSVMPLGLGYSIDPETGRLKLDFSNVTGINAEEAIKKAKQYDNVQLILVGISDTNIELALAGEDVTFVIPFHGSGQSVDQVQTLVNLLGEDLDVTMAQDYSDVQDDHVSPNQTPEQKAMWKLRMDIIQGKFWKKPTKSNPAGTLKPFTAEQQALYDSNPHLQRLFDMFYNESPSVDENGNPLFTKYMLNEEGKSIAYHCFLGKEQAKKIFPYEYWDTSLDYDHADGNGENFKSYCASMGIIPRFSGMNADGEVVDHGNFADKKGYWKLLIDRKMYKNRYDSKGNWVGYGEYRNQQRINVSDVKTGMLDESQVQQTLSEKSWTKPINSDKTERIVEKSIDRIAQMHEDGDIYDTKKISKEFRQARLDANKDAREAEQQRASVQEEIEPDRVTAEDLKDKNYTGDFSSEDDWVKAVKENQDSINYDALQSRWKSLTPDRMRKLDKDMVDILDLISPENNTSMKVRANELIARNIVRLLDHGLLSEAEVTFMMRNLSKKSLERFQKFTMHDFLERDYKRGFAAAKNLFRNQQRALNNLEPHIGEDLQVEQYGQMSSQDIKKLYDYLTSKTNKETNALAKKVFDWAAKMEKAGYAIPFKFRDLPQTDGKTTAGAHLGGKVRYDTNYFNDPDIPNGKKAQVLLHETIHAYSAYAINIVKAYEEIENNPATRYRGGNQIVAAYKALPPDVVESVHTLNSIWEQIKDDPDFDGFYGTTNTAEMVAELSNASFRDALKKKSLLQKVLDAVKRLFGINATSAYDAVSAGFDKLMTSSMDPEIQRSIKNMYEAASKQYASFYAPEEEAPTQYGKYTIPSKANLTERRAQEYNGVNQQRYSQQESEDNGRETDVPRGMRPVVRRLDQLVQGNDWTRAYIEGSRKRNSGIQARAAWRTDERRQRRVADFAVSFFETNKLFDERVDHLEKKGTQTGEKVFEYGVPDFLDWFFSEAANDPDKLAQVLYDGLDNAEIFLDKINKAMTEPRDPQFSHRTFNALDNEYMEAIEANDIEKLQKMIQGAARKAGYTMDFYQHARVRFNQFSRGELGFHVGSWTQAANFVNAAYRSVMNNNRTDAPDLFLHLYADIKNPYVLPKAEIFHGADERNDYNSWDAGFVAGQLLRDEEFFNSEYRDELAEIERSTNGLGTEYKEDVRERLTNILDAMGYDALEYTNAAEGNKDRDSGEAFIVWDPNKLKSADLITYDGNGDVIPLSERFNPDDSWFRYSMQEEAPITNPFTEGTLEYDIMDKILKGGDKAVAEWATKELAKQNQKLESAKVIPPRVPTKSFVPMPTKEERELLEKERLDRIGRYGAHNPSEKADSDYVLPKKNNQGLRQSRFAQNVATANVLNEPAKDLTKRFAFTSPDAVYVDESNKTALDNAKKKIQNNGLEYSVKSFVEQAEEATWSYAGENSLVNVLALGQQLLIETSQNGTYRDYLDVLSSLTLLATQAGKSLQAFRMLKQAGPIGELYYVQKTVNQMNNKQYAKLQESGKMKPITVDPELEKAVVLASTEKERTDAMEVLIASIAKQVPITIMDKWNAWRHLAMLGNARTHIRNVFGNAIFVPLRFGKDLVATAGESIAVKTGLMKETERTKALTVSRELREFAKKDALVMKKELQGNGKYNPAQEIMDARQIFWWKGLDKARKWNGEKLEEEDWMFLAPAYQRALGMALQNSGYSVEQLQSDPEGQKVLNRARQVALEEAQRATYRDFSVAAAALNRLKRGGGAAGILLEGVLPFTKTPINILRRGVEYSPVGIATALIGLAKDYRSGNINAAQFIDRMSAGLTGTGVAILGYLLAGLGWVRGKKDDKEEEFEKLQGYQDYSLQIGNVSMTIDWAAPTALPIFTGVVAYDMLRGGEKLSFATVYDTILLLAEPMTQLSMLDGLNRTLSAASYAGENEKIASIVTSAATSYLGQGVPTLLGQLARSMDGTRRQTYIDKNSKVPAGLQRFIQSSIQNKIPVWESEKAPYIDQWGREDTSKSKALGALENFFSPSYVNFVNTTDVDRSLQAIYETTNDANVLPSSPGKTIGKRNLTAEEYTALARDVGSTKYELLAQLFSDARFNALTDAQKVKIIHDYIYSYATAAGKYHIDPTYDIKGQGKWIMEAEAMPNEMQRYNRIWEQIEKYLENN